MSLTFHPKGIVVMAEVNRSPSVVGIMCRLLGFELELPSGKIIQRMQPKKVARRG